MSAIARTLNVVAADMPGASHSMAAGTMNMTGSPTMAAHGSMGADARTLGIAADRMGMSMDMSALPTANPFDRAFIGMIPHHQGAIRMARAELGHGIEPRLRRIARAIIAAQTREIHQMNRWRTSWFGIPSPAGGVPAA